MKPLPLSGAPRRGLADAFGAAPLPIGARLPRKRFLIELAACVAITLVAGLGSALAQGSQAQDARAGGALRLELNRLEPQGESCRAYLVIENPSAQAYRSLKLDLFAFDAEGVIGKRVAVELGPLPARKTTVRLFDFTGLPCERFSRVLLNDVLACEAEGAKPDCLALIETASKQPRVGFVK